MTDPHAAVPYDDLDQDEELAPPAPPAASPRSRSVALALNVLLGLFGGHRFYVGKVHSGVWQMLTLGGLGLWWLYDFILIATGEFTDARGRRLRHWSPDEAGGAGPGDRAQVAHLTHEVEALQAQVNDLNERMDFTERMLTQQRERGRLS